ncbi:MULTISPECIES: DUF1127 domain-containing protein [Microvirga]|uniref:DUF1127 domain-containing protein n=1 Tax=Microvirga TaxID=186650 RepID=UPI001CFF9669|nr:DUF1127 domain-containing protein [Microvirga lenta]MCB5175355.1 DUF1127 domain-containing protein [Microvirga lenta]
MAKTIGSTTSFSGRVLVQWISRAVGNLVKNVRHRQEIKALTDLDDRLLKDIGLTRDDVQGALSKSLLRNPSVVLVQSMERQARSERPKPSRRPVVPTVTRPEQACA